MLDRYLDTDLLVAVALGALVVPGVFLALVALAASRRMGGRQIGATLAATLTFAGGASAGTLLLMAPDITIAAPLVIVVGAIAVSRFRARRRGQTGWLLLGAGLPLAMLLALLLLGAGFAARTAVPTEIVLWLGAGAVVSVLAVALLLRGDPPAAAPSMAAPAGQPGSRSIGSIAEAIREPSMLGPFGLPELAMLASFVAVWLVVPLLLPAGTHVVIRVLVPSLLVAVVGTEAYIRSMPPRQRRAFEAFSWLGEWELARARAIVGGSLPSSPEEAADWLGRHPEGPILLEGELAVRVEIELLAGRIDEARGLVGRLPTETPWARFEVAALHDLVEWRAGADGAEAEAHLEAAERAGVAIEPADGDERLRADVTVAVARVRRRMADGRSTPGDAADPLLEVRERLGSRADGQVGRALRRRLIPVVLVASVVLALLAEVASGI